VLALARWLYYGRYEPRQYRTDFGREIHRRTGHWVRHRSPVSNVESLTAISMTTVVGPTFLVEVAPKAVRGMLTNIFAGSVYLGVMIAYFSNWGASINISSESRMQWVAPQTAHLGFAG
jgi:hypothetical protein